MRRDLTYDKRIRGAVLKAAYGNVRLNGERRYVVIDLVGPAAHLVEINSDAALWRRPTETYKIRSVRRHMQAVYR